MKNYKIKSIFCLTCVFSVQKYFFIFIILNNLDYDFQNCFYSFLAYFCLKFVLRKNFLYYEANNIIYNDIFIKNIEKKVFFYIFYSFIIHIIFRAWLKILKTCLKVILKQYSLKIMAFLIKKV